MWYEFIHRADLDEVSNIRGVILEIVCFEKIHLLHLSESYHNILFLYIYETIPCVQLLVWCLEESCFPGQGLYGGSIRKLF